MSITSILDLSFFTLAMFDGWLTRRRIIDYGIDVELNRFIHKLYHKFGVELAILLAIIIPTVLICIILTLLNWPVLLALLIGIRLHLFYIQLESLTFEERLKNFAADLKDTGERNTNPRTPLLRDSTLTSDDNMLPTTSTEDKDESTNRPKQ